MAIDSFQRSHKKGPFGIRKKYSLRQSNNRTTGDFGDLFASQWTLFLKKIICTSTVKYLCRSMLVLQNSDVLNCFVQGGFFMS